MNPYSHIETGYAGLIRSWRLAEASEAQRQHFEILGDGQGIHWPDLDEDICVEGMLNGTPASHPPSSTKEAA